MDYKEKFISLINDETLPIEQRKKLEEIFNACIESEDEKIIKAIVAHIKGMRYYDIYYGVTPDEMVAWLEKQGEDKKESSTWSKEDEQSKKWILEYLYDGLRKSDEQFKDQFKAAIEWLKNQNKERRII